MELEAGAKLEEFKTWSSFYNNKVSRRDGDRDGGCSLSKRYVTALQQRFINSKFADLSVT